MSRTSRTTLRLASQFGRIAQTYGGPARGGSAGETQGRAGGSGSG